MNEIARLRGWVSHHGIVSDGGEIDAGKGKISRGMLWLECLKVMRLTFWQYMELHA
jgi:hypothetical protein